MEKLTTSVRLSISAEEIQEFDRYFGSRVDIFGRIGSLDVGKLYRFYQYIITKKFDVRTSQLGIVMQIVVRYLSRLNRNNILMKSVGVCGATWTPGMVCFKCKDCEFDPTCAICESCFKNGDHKDHDYAMVTSSSGICDCGDPDSWKRSGFCKNHKGPEADPLGHLTPELVERLQSVGNALVDGLTNLLTNESMKMKININTEGSSTGGIDYKMIEPKIDGYVKFLLSIIKSFPCFKRLIGSSLSSRNYPSEEDQEITILQKLLSIQASLLGHNRKSMYELYNTLISDSEFKINFTSLFCDEYRRYCVSMRKYEGKQTPLASITVQLLTIPSLIENILIPKNFMMTVLNTTIELIEDYSSRMHFGRKVAILRNFKPYVVYHCIIDMQYLFNSGETSRMILTTPSLLERYLDFLSLFQYSYSVTRVDRDDIHERFKEIGAMEFFRIPKIMRLILRNGLSSLRQRIFKIRDGQKEEEGEGPDESGPRIREALIGMVRQVLGKIHDFQEKYLEGVYPLKKREEKLKVLENVIDGPISFHIPLHHFFGYLIHSIHRVFPELNIYDDILIPSFQKDEEEGVLEESMIWNTLIYPLKNLMCSVHVVRGFWKRNCLGIANLSFMYFGNPSSYGYCLLNDHYLTQLLIPMMMRLKSCSKIMIKMLKLCSFDSSDYFKIKMRVPIGSTESSESSSEIIAPEEPQEVEVEELTMEQRIRRRIQQLAERAFELQQGGQMEPGQGGDGGFLADLAGLVNLGRGPNDGGGGQGQAQFKRVPVPNQPKRFFSSDLGKTREDREISLEMDFLKLIIRLLTDTTLFPRNYDLLARSFLLQELYIQKSCPRKLLRGCVPRILRKGMNPEKLDLLLRNIAEFQLVEDAGSYVLSNKELWKEYNPYHNSVSFVPQIHEKCKERYPYNGTELLQNLEQFILTNPLSFFSDEKKSDDDDDDNIIISNRKDMAKYLSKFVLENEVIMKLIFVVLFRTLRQRENDQVFSEQILKVAIHLIWICLVILENYQSDESMKIDDDDDSEEEFEENNVLGYNFVYSDVHYDKNNDFLGWINEKIIVSQNKPKEKEKKKEEDEKSFEDSANEILFEKNEEKKTEEEKETKEEEEEERPREICVLEILYELKEFKLMKKEILLVLKKIMKLAQKKKRREIIITIKKLKKKSMMSSSSSSSRKNPFITQSSDSIDPKDQKKEENEDDDDENEDEEIKRKKEMMRLRKQKLMEKMNRMAKKFEESQKMTSSSSSTSSPGTPTSALQNLDIDPFEKALLEQEEEKKDDVDDRKCIFCHELQSPQKETLLSRLCNFNQSSIHKIISDQSFRYFTELQTIKNHHHEEESSSSERKKEEMILKFQNEVNKKMSKFRFLHGSQKLRFYALFSSLHDLHHTEPLMPPLLLSSSSEEERKRIQEEQERQEQEELKKRIYIKKQKRIYYELFSPNELKSNFTQVTGCGHYCHASCFHLYWMSLLQSRIDRRSFKGSKVLVLERTEILCPICSRLQNSFISSETFANFNISKEKEEKEEEDNKSNKLKNEMEDNLSHVMQRILSIDNDCYEDYGLMKKKSSEEKEKKEILLSSSLSVNMNECDRIRYLINLTNVLSSNISVHNLMDNHYMFQLFLEFSDDEKKNKKNKIGKQVFRNRDMIFVFHKSREVFKESVAQMILHELIDPNVSKYSQEISNILSDNIILKNKEEIIEVEEEKNELKNLFEFPFLMMDMFSMFVKKICFDREFICSSMLLDDGVGVKEEEFRRKFGEMMKIYLDGLVTQFWILLHSFDEEGEEEEEQSKKRRRYKDEDENI